GAEVDLPRGPQDLAHGGEELLDAVEAHRLVVRAVRERRGRDEAHELAAALRHHLLELCAHVRDAAVAEARLEHERRLAEGARVDAAARDLDRVPLAVARVDRGEIVERPALGGRPPGPREPVALPARYVAPGAGHARQAEKSSHTVTSPSPMTQRSKPALSVMRGSALACTPPATWSASGACSLTHARSA